MDFCIFLGLLYLALAAVMAVWLVYDFRVWRNLRKAREEYHLCIDRIIARENAEKMGRVN